MDIILYVEDEPDVREITAFALEDDFELIACASGKDALEKAPNGKPTLLMLDVMMPDMDGPTTLRHLREHAHLASLPVIFMTAKVQTTEIQEYLDMGALGVISKPFDPMSLADDIRRILEDA